MMVAIRSGTERAACAFRCLLAFALVASLALVVPQGGVREAHASTGSANLAVGDSIYYAGWGTTKMWCGDAMAFCGQPAKATPASGGYEKHDVMTGAVNSSQIIREQILSTLYYGIGGPGFDTSLWPSTWYDGSLMNEERYIVCSHIMLTDFYTLDFHAAVYGCSQDFVDWARSTITGIEDDGTTQVPNFENTVRHRMTVNKAPAGFEAFTLVTGSGSQNIISFETGHDVSVVKKSGNPDITVGNSCYSLEGTAYSFYRNGTDYVGAIELDGAGATKAALKLPSGRYMYKETATGEGYKTDNAEHWFDVADYDVVLQAVDFPDNDPVGMLLGKHDGGLKYNGAGNLPQGAAGLDGAKFEARFYGGYYDSADEAEKSGTLLRTWVVKTDSDGFTYLSDEYKVSGDSWFVDGTAPTLPLGTLVCTEIEAPDGYNLDDGRGGAPEVFVRQITQDGPTGSAVSTYNSPEVADSVKRGDYQLEKVLYTNLDPADQQMTKIPVQGIEFSFTLVDEGGPNDGQTVDSETGRQWRITTDENGHADTVGLRTGNGKTVTGGLPYGTFRIHENIPKAVSDRIAAEYGIGILPVDDWLVTISEEGQFDPVQIVEDNQPQTPLKIVKKDSTTGKVIPDAATFRIFDADGELVTYTSHYPEESVLSEWTTLNGSLTLPMKLAGGDYTLVEVESPEGYLLSPDPIAFTVDDYRDWDNPVVIEVGNEPARASLEIVKDDAATGEPVAGAEYSVRAVADVVTGDGTVRFAAGEIVASGVLTDDTGRALVEGLFPGLYSVYETKSPEGMALDTAEHEVEIVPQGGDVPVVEVRVGLTDEPTTLKVKKIDSVTGEPVAGAEFRIWEDAAEPVATYDVDSMLPAIAEALSESQGATEVAAHNAESVLAQLAEAKPGDAVAFHIGGKADGKTVDFAIKVSFLEDFSVHATCEGKDVCDVEPLLVKDDAAFDLTAVSGEDGWIEVSYLPHGKALNVVETKAAPGYVLPDGIEPVRVEVDDQGLIGGETSWIYEVENGTTTIEVSKLDTTGRHEIEGAQMQVLDAAGNVVDEWVSDGTPHRIEGLEPGGTYALVEVLAPAEYEKAESVEFTVEATTEVQHVVMYDQPIEVSVEIDKRQTIADAQGVFSYTLDYRSTSSTWADELTVTDPLDCVNSGLARLSSVTTPVCFEDWDGMMAVWYQTNLNDKQDASDALEHNAMAADPDNPHNPDKVRQTDFMGWKYWGETPTLAAETFDVDSLELADGEYVTAIRFEHGRVEAAFATRAGEWDREDLKAEDDNLQDAAASHEGSFNLADANGSTKSDERNEVRYAPAVLNVKAVSEDFFVGKTELRNAAEVGIWRNVVLNDDDDDAVAQRTRPETPSAPEDGAMPKTGDAIVAWLPYVGLAVVAVTAVGVAVAWRRMRKHERDELAERGGGEDGE